MQGFWKDSFKNYTKDKFKYIEKEWKSESSFKIEIWSIFVNEKEHIAFYYENAWYDCFSKKSIFFIILLILKFKNHKEKKMKNFLIDKICNVLKKAEKREMTLTQIYEKLPEEKQHSIRGRINESVKIDDKIIRTGKGKYMLIGIDIEAFIQESDVKVFLPQIMIQQVRFKMAILDFPYNLGGQKGGNRNLSNYGMIEPEEAQEIVKQIESMLQDEYSQIYFMIAGGKSSIRKAQKYMECFDNTSLKLAGEGSYLKLNKNGSVCNMGKYPMPKEIIQVYSPSGELLKPEQTILDFKEVRPPLPRSGGYPTQKPYNMIKQMISQGSFYKDKVLDLFAGSGVGVDAGLDLGRIMYTCDNNPLSIQKFLLPILQKHQKLQLDPLRV